VGVGAIIFPKNVREKTGKVFFVHPILWGTLILNTYRLQYTHCQLYIQHNTLTSFYYRLGGGGVETVRGESNENLTDGYLVRIGSSPPTPPPFRQGSASGHARTNPSLILSSPTGVAGKRLPVLADEGGGGWWSQVRRRDDDRGFLSILPLWSGQVIHFYAL
jgi:hypothetical protein